MKRAARFIRTISCFLFLTAARCATAHNGRLQHIDVASDPPGAAVRVECLNRPAVTATTPARVDVNRRADPCFISISKPGYREERVPLQRKTSKRIWGNLAALPAGAAIYISSRECSSNHLICNYPGWLTSGVLVGGALAGTGVLIDRATGGAWEHLPKAIRVTLVPDPQGQRSNPGTAPEGRQ